MEGFDMKKFLVLVMALAAVFCFAGCEDGKCDDCGRKGDDVKVYEKWDDDELCLSCVAKRVQDALLDEMTGGN